MKKDHPGIYIPPPLIYVAFFFFSVFLQKNFPLGNGLGPLEAAIPGCLFIAMAVILIIPAVRRFIVSRNTLITVKPANSLQTTGIYAFTRNPMYLGLLMLYCGIAFFKGNWWTFILAPVLIMVIHTYLIKKEENYLQRAFGEEYTVYRLRVRSWV